jgi:transposase
MSAGYEKAVRDSIAAKVSFDPFHLVQLGSAATDQVRRAEYNNHGRSSSDSGKWIKGVRYSLLKDPTKQTTEQLLRLCEVQQTNKRIFRAALICGELRYLYKVPKDQAKERLEGWLAWASRSRLKPFVKLARTIRKHKPSVLAAIELGISNGRLEALNSKVRLLSHRAYGFHSADALIAMIYPLPASRSLSLTDESPPNREKSRFCGRRRRSRPQQPRVSRRPARARTPAGRESAAPRG